MGAPLPCNSIKLVDVAEMNYLAVNGEGEVTTQTHARASRKTYKNFIDNVFLRLQLLLVF